MAEDNVIAFANPASELAIDPLTEVLRQGARRLLAEAVEAEVEQFLERYRTVQDAAGRQRVVRNGYLPERTLQTGIGEVEVKVPRVRDRGPGAEPAAPIRFDSAVVPKYLPKSARVEELIPCLYLRGLSTQDFQTALTALLGEHAQGFSAPTLSRLKAAWAQELKQWQKRDLSGKHYVYFWADGIYFHARAEAERSCVLVLIGATAQGQKELVALEEGFRESTASWTELLRPLRERGLTHGPALAVGDGGLGFWAALRDVYPATRAQRCWVHKTVNVLDKLPKSQQAKAKAALHEIWQAPTRAEADHAFEAFLKRYEAKYPKATECLAKDRDSLLTFYDFPAEHWQHVRTTNPIESTFATVRLRTVKTRNCLSRQTLLSMVFKLCQSAQQRWLRLRGTQRLTEVIEGRAFVNGVRQPVEADSTAQAIEVESTRSAA